MSSESWFRASGLGPRASGGRRPAAGLRHAASDVRRPAAGVRRPAAGGRHPAPAVRRPRSDIGQPLRCRVLPICACSLAATLLVASGVHAGGFTQTTFGGRRTGMQTNLAAPDDLTALFHNPAGLAGQRGIRVHLSGSAAFVQQSFRLKAQDPALYPEIYKGCEQGDPTSETCPWPVGADGYYRDPIEPDRSFGLLPYVGLSSDLGFLGRRGRELVVSAAVTAPQFTGAYLPEDAPTAYNIIGGMFLVISTTVGVGWQPHPKISLGASLSYNYMSIEMSQKMSLAAALSSVDPTLARAAQAFLGDVKLQYGGVDHGVGWSLGLLVQPLPWLSLGLSYSGATSAQFEGDVSFEALGSMARKDPALLAGMLKSFGYKLPAGLEVEMPIPHNLQGGLNFELTRGLELGFDVRVWLYNLIERQRRTPIYAPGEGKEPISEDMLSTTKDYSISYQVGGGLLFRPFGRDRSLEIMMGVGYDHSPTPGYKFTMDNPALTHVKVSAGLRWIMMDRWRLALTYFINIASDLDIRNSQTSPPTNVQGGGTTHSPGLEVEYLYD